MEGGLYQAALVQPGVPVVRHQSQAEKRSKQLVGEDVFVVIAVILLQDVLHAVRVIDKVSRREHETHTDNITVLARPCQKSQRVALHLTGTPEERKAAKTRRRFVTRHLCAVSCARLFCLYDWFRHSLCSFR